MRTTLVLTAVAFVGISGALLFWRPVAALMLAMLGGAISLWRMDLPARVRSRRAKRPPRPEPAPRPLVAASAIPFAPDPALLERVTAAGWTLEPANRGEPWLVAVREEVRVALRPAPAGPRACAEDIMDALSAKRTEAAQYAAILCTHRPEEHLGERAKQAQVHIINLARLEAYLTLASSFRPSPTVADQEQVTA